MQATTSAPGKATRTLSFTPNADEFSPTAGVLTIAAGKTTAVYVVCEFPTGHPGRGFQLTKVGGGEGYGVFVCHRGPAGDSCECGDAHYRGRACKHVAAVRKLIELGRI